MTHHDPKSPERGSLEVVFPEISQDQFEPLLCLLVEVLIQERTTEIGRGEYEDGGNSTRQERQLGSR